MAERMRTRTKSPGRWSEAGKTATLFWEVLPYKVPIATQSAMVLPYDMEGDILNDVGNMDKSVRMQYVHIAVLPLEEKSVVLFNI